ncbi:hypothetical protein [Lacticaseibacillus nasuensis]|uniref:hypothetical protein n=1 Tax=Lacticaseibacillus nasuensis TaxID=944671 RepID=UPI0007049950|nr:hypothetical protein [Lacticaseibacillus nasuensis]
MAKNKQKTELTNAERIALLTQEWEAIKKSLDNQEVMGGEDDRYWSLVFIETELVQLQIDEEVRKALEDKPAK